MTTMTEPERTVMIAGAGIVAWSVVHWWASVERVVGQFWVEGERVMSPYGLPPVAQTFADHHAEELLRLVRAAFQTA
jgi:hypothetical protein